MKRLFGEPERQAASTSASGFGALPGNIQSYFTNIASGAQGITPEMFRPMGFGQEELMAQQMLNPENISESIQNYLNPYRDIVISDINRQFESPFGALASQASEAGAFGGSRYRQGQSDLERARLDAISNAMSGQYNTAFNQMSQGISNLLGFGGLERQLDLSQRQALPQSLAARMEILAPLLGASTSTGGITKAPTGGLVGDVTKVANLVGGLGSLFSDRRLKRNIKKVGFSNGLNEYEYEYLWSPKKYRGYMAQEVEKVHPYAISESHGFKKVNYGALNG